MSNVIPICSAWGQKNIVFIWHYRLLFTFVCLKKFNFFLFFLYQNQRLIQKLSSTSAILLAFVCQSSDSSEQINHYSFSFQPRIYFSVFWVFVRWELHGSAVIFKQWRQKIKQPICTPIRWGQLQQGFESCDTVLKNLINSTCTLLKIIRLRWKFKFQLLFINKLYGKCLF